MLGAEITAPTSGPSAAHSDPISRLQSHTGGCVSKSSLPSQTTSHLGGLEQGTRLLCASISPRRDKDRNSGWPYGSMGTRSALGRKLITERRELSSTCSTHTPSTRSATPSLCSALHCRDHCPLGKTHSELPEVRRKPGSKGARLWWRTGSLSCLDDASPRRRLKGAMQN